MPYADPEKAIAHAREYRRAHPEQRRAIVKRYADAHREQRKQYYLVTRDVRLVQMKEYAKRKRAEARARGEVWRKGRSVELQKNANLRFKYGLTLDDYNAMVAEQGGLCALCDEPGALTVDHDHESGRVRALLCIGCNSALGRFECTILKLGIDKVLAYIQR